MRMFLALAAFPLFAAAPVRVSITQAAVTWGAGIEPRGDMPPGQFEARVLITGGKRSARPSIRAWRVKIGDFPSREAKTAKCPNLGNALSLKLTTTREAAGTWVIHGPWPEALEPEDRLVVKVFSGARSLGWASCQPTEQLIQSVGRPPESNPQ